MSKELAIKGENVKFLFTYRKFKNACKYLIELKCTADSKKLKKIVILQQII